MANRTYEVMYIIDPETAVDKIATLNETISQLIEKEGGTIVRMDDIGRRKLAYTINKKQEGHYVLFEIDGSGQEIMELERRMRVNDQILRYITVRVDEDRKKADKIQAKRDARTNKRARFRKTEETAETVGEAAV
ncbi:MAG: 30S ribosomal protein S6 [Blastocatellia bacterium]|nr:30S ribosomal protein S6 [Blastocatellia bacterium]